MEAVVVIPIYKEQPSEKELASFKQCFKVLKSHPIYIITYPELNIDVYHSVVDRTFNIRYFDSHYFSSIKTYNKLMREHLFYKSFKDFEYMLIYQLDAWVFKDELEMWCEKGYDYIGAPWFTNYSSHETGGKLWRVGNGGFSLRKIKTFIKLTNPNRRLKRTSDVFKTEYRGIKSIPSCLLRSFGHRNNVGFYRNFYSSKNEDVYFCIEMQEFRNMRLNIPTPEEASLFSLERSPKHLFEKNNQELPMGCHAWERYDKEFMQKYCKNDVFSVVG